MKPGVFRLGLKRDGTYVGGLDVWCVKVSAARPIEARETVSNYLSLVLGPLAD